MRRAVIIAILALCAVCVIATTMVIYLRPKPEGPLTVYVVPHVDDIDGGIDPGWFFFFDRLRQWHDRNSIPASFAFYPGTMNDEQFNRIIAEMYTSRNVELVLKGEDEFQGQRLDQMAPAEVRKTLMAWRDKFVSEMEQLGYSNVKVPVGYNQLMMRLTETIRDAAHEVGFRICLEHGESEHGVIEMLPDFDITQYSVSLTVSGQAGPNEVFKEPEQLMQELLEFESDNVLYIGGIKVVPLVCNQRDFQLSDGSLVLDEEKWDAYKSLLLRAKKDSRIRLLQARDVYELRHPERP
jgi:hypothetical protein